jgi:hypothetical protein
MEEPVTLNIADLQTMVNIIDACSQRGAFKAEELATVGAVYNKLVAFVNQQPAQPSAGPVIPEADESAQDSQG